MSPGHEDEGVLKDVLDELDRERAERAELEASVRTLQLEVQKYKAAAEQPQQKEPTKDSSAAQAIDKQQYTKYEYLVLQTEKDGYLELIDAILKERPAFSHPQMSESSSSSSSKNSRSSSHQSMPMHVLRLLEGGRYTTRSN